MADAPKLDVRPRTVLGKKVGALRRAGRLPAVIFGGHADSTPIETDASAFQRGYRRWGQTTLLSLTGLDGGEVPVLIHDVAREPRTGSLLHVDFARVSLTEKTHAEVPLHFAGESPAVRTHGGVMMHALSGLRIEAYPQDIPHQIEVDLARIEQIDDALFVRDLVIDATTVRILNDPDELVAKAVAARVEEEVKPAVVAVEGELAEGEVAAEGEAPAAGAAPAAAGAKGAPAAGAAPGAPAGKAAQSGQPERKGR